jgi:hypothetical protein
MERGLSGFSRFYELSALIRSIYVIRVPFSEQTGPPQLPYIGRILLHNMVTMGI